MDPAVRRLAIPVSDHDLGAAEFEAVHTGASRGSGAVIIWDEGIVEVLRDVPEHLSFVLDGRKLAGRLGVTKTANDNWILVKANDEHARPDFDVIAAAPTSVRSGRTCQQVPTESARFGDA